jgi:hypothetical protein
MPPPPRHCYLTVMWLFEKHRRGRDWPETIRVYNAGKAAQQYRDSILKRAQGARTKAAAGQEFVPSR